MGAEGTHVGEFYLLELYQVLRVRIRGKSAPALAGKGVFYSV